MAQELKKLNNSLLESTPPALPFERLVPENVFGLSQVSLPQLPICGSS